METYNPIIELQIEPNKYGETKIYYKVTIEKINTSVIGYSLEDAFKKLENVIKKGVRK